jgi:purine-binding chemotaxis protein CheW
MAIEILVFEVDGQRFGVRSADVVQVLRAATLAPLPQAPAPIEGVLNLRGCLVPVLDTRRLLGLPAREMQHTDHLIVVITGEQVVTLRVDRAMNLVRLESDQAEAAGSADHVHLIEFVAKTGAGLVHVLDPQRLLSGEAAASIVKALVKRTATEVTR